MKMIVWSDVKSLQSVTSMSFRAPRKYLYLDRVRADIFEIGRDSPIVYQRLVAGFVEIAIVLRKQLPEGKYSEQ
jgi:hypothetical protein